MPLNLPTGRLRPSTSLFDYNFTFIGAKGTGKSTLAGSFPSAEGSDIPALVARFEPGRGNVHMRQYPENPQQVLGWYEWEELCDQLIEQGERFVVVDTPRDCWEACVRDVCKKHFGKSNPALLPNDKAGGAWGLISSTFKNHWKKCVASGLHRIFTGHSANRPVEDQLGNLGNHSVVTLDCSDSPRQAVLGQCDCVWFLGFQKNRRILTVRTTNNADIKTGVATQMLDPKGNRLSKIELPHVADEADPLLFQTIQDAWNNLIYDADIDEEDIEEDEDNDDDDKPVVTIPAAPVGRTKKKIVKKVVRKPAV